MLAHGSISVVVPIFNERDSLVELHGELCRVLVALGCPYEIIFVDDGSTDGSLSVLRTVQSSDVHVVVVELRRNFGKAIALQAGFQVAQGDIVITMDGDLQDDPDEIPRFLAMLEDGFDLVSGWKKNRQDSITKTLPSRLFNFSTSLLTGIPLRDFNCGFKAYRKEVVERLDVYGELHRYIPVLAHAKGFRVGEVPVRHHPRRYGESKYSFERFLRGALDLLTVLFLSRFRRRPLHLFGLLGLVITLFGFAIDFYLTVLWLIGDRPIGDRPLLAFGTLLIIVGIQILVFGLIAEMLTAVTYRRSDVMELIRKVDRHQCVTEHSVFDGCQHNVTADQEVRHDV